MYHVITFCLFRLSTSSDDSASESTVTLALGRVLYDVNSRLKLAAAYFSGKEIVRLYRRSQLILAAVY